MPAANDIDPYESPLAYFGAAVRRNRLRLGLIQTELGKRINYSDDTISKIENGDQVPTVAFGEACDREFGTQEEMKHLAIMARKTGVFPTWLRPWVEAEREARKLRNWEPLIVPGLLQTPEYARALLSRRPGATEEKIEEQVTARIDRQKILESKTPPLLWVVIDERVLYDEVGSPEVMRDQLHALIKAAQRPHITIQVVPRGSHAPGLAGAFAIADARQGGTIVYLESHLEGQVTDRPEDVEMMTDTFDAIRAKALRDDESVDLIAKVMEEQWT